MPADGAKPIETTLRSNTSLTELDLSGSAYGLKSNELASIAEGIRMHEGLRDVTLDGDVVSVSALRGAESQAVVDLSGRQLGFFSGSVIGHKL